nr:hypothetical protein CFP56_00413 [Quercus suber]
MSDCGGGKLASEGHERRNDQGSIEYNKDIACAEPLHIYHSVDNTPESLCCTYTGRLRVLEERENNCRPCRVGVLSTDTVPYPVAASSRIPVSTSSTSCPVSTHHNGLVPISARRVLFSPVMMRDIRVVLGSNPNFGTKTVIRRSSKSHLSIYLSYRKTIVAIDSVAIAQPGLLSPCCNQMRVLQARPEMSITANVVILTCNCPLRVILLVMDRDPRRTCSYSAQANYRTTSSRDAYESALDACSGTVLNRSGDLPAHKDL